MVALIRHAHAPGTGDPAGFRLDDCATQRNLSEGGRRQASELGRRLREAGTELREVRSSRWCRCLETARLAFPDIVSLPEPALDSFFEGRDRGPEQTRLARALIQTWSGKAGVLAMVTHQVNITALTGLHLPEGAAAILMPSASGPQLIGDLLR